MLGYPGSWWISTGWWPDIEIFHHGLGSWLNLNEHIDADDRYTKKMRLKCLYPLSVSSPFTDHEM